MPSPLRFIDTHAHFDLEEFQCDYDLLLTRCREGVFPSPVDQAVGGFSYRLVAAIDPGVSAAASRRSLALAERYSFLWSAVAVHPNYTAEATEEDWKQISQLADSPKVVAIGETGLDRHWDDSPIQTQIQWFQRHIVLAKEKKLPLIIHCREAIDDLLPILRNACEETKCDPRNSEISGTVHSFSEGPEEAEELIRLGFYLGFTGSVTYTQKKFAPLWEAARRVPADRFLLETDSPFLIPHPFRGKLDRNEPLMTLYVARRLAELRGTTVSEIVTQSTENARRLFRRMKEAL